MIKTKVLIALIAVITLISITACSSTPVDSSTAILGTWTSSNNSTITFNSDGTAVNGSQVYSYTIEGDTITIDTKQGLIYSYKASSSKEYSASEDNTWYVDSSTLRLGNTVYTK